MNITASSNTDFSAVNQAFSRQSEGYDTYDENNPILRWMRRQVQDHVMKYLRPGDKMLELNAGTGIDAIYFAREGCLVHATDLSDGMIAQLKNKVKRYQLEERICVQQCSFEELHNIHEENFDYIFSNFGGLNCTSDLREVLMHLPKLLKPGGYVTLVIMPPVCPWEIFLSLRGNFKTAFRRLSKGGTSAHILGVFFHVYYFTPRQVMEALGKGFKRARLQGLASISPPPYRDDFPKVHPRLYRWLTAIDAKLSSIPPFNTWADHFTLTVQYLPS